MPGNGILYRVPTNAPRPFQYPEGRSQHVLIEFHQKSDPGRLKVVVDGSPLAPLHRPGS
jgi:hypothetical protein